MTQARIEVTYFYFGTIVVSEDNCEGDLRSGIVDLKFEEKKDKKKFDIKEEVAKPPKGLTLPPKKEPDSPYVGPLQKKGFSPRPVAEDFVNQGGEPTAQPAALGRVGLYKSLDLSYTSVFLCSCREKPKNCKAARILLRVKYDGRNHPTVEAKATKTRDCKDSDKIFADKFGKALKPSKKTEAAYEKPKFSKKALRKFLERLGVFKRLKKALSKKKYEKQLKQSTDIVFKNGANANTDGRGKRTLRLEYLVDLPCDCGAGAEKPCRVKIVCEYNYRTVPK